MKEEIPQERRSEAPPNEAGSISMSDEGLKALRTIVAERRTELGKEEREKMLREIERDPELFDPSARFSDSKNDVSVRIPIWVYYYLERRKRATGESISKQIADITTEFVAREMLSILGRDEK